MAITPIPFVLSGPLPENPFYYAPGYLLKGENGSYILGSGLVINNTTGTLEAVGVGAVNSLTVLGPGLSVNATVGAVTISNTGVTRLIGTSGITVSQETGDIIISGCSGTVTQVTGTNGITGNVTTVGSLGLTNTGVTPDTYYHPNLTIDQTGRITAAIANPNLVNAALPLTVSTPIQGEFALSINPASLTTCGAVRLSDSVTLASSDYAATSCAVKCVYDIASVSIPYTCFTSAGQLLVSTGTNSYIALPRGTGDGQVLTVCTACNTTGGVTWSAGSGFGTVKSICAGNGLTASLLNPITTCGTIAINYACVVGACTFCLKGDIVAATGPNTFSKVAVGLDGQVLTADSVSPQGVSWTSVVPAIPCACLVCKGALVTAMTPGIPFGLEPGANGTVLTADSTQPAGLRWRAISADPATPLVRGVVFGCSTPSPTAITLLGSCAGAAFGTSLGDAAFNTGIGAAALKSLTTGTQNTAVGYAALCLLAGTAGCNVAIGGFAGCTQTGGSYNVIIGPGVQAASASGSCQLAIGFSDTDNWITGNSTKAIRPGAGIIDCAGSCGTSGQVLLSTGTNAVCWGSAGGGGAAQPTTRGTVFGVSATTTSGDNSLIGYSSGASISLDAGGNPLSSQNASVGNESLADMACGIGNVAAGYRALKTLSNGCGNVSIGRNSGDLITSSSYNVMIGDGVTIPTIASILSPSNSCQMAIGFSAGCYWLMGTSQKHVKFGAGILDCNNTIGAAGDVLASTGSGNLVWQTGTTPNATPICVGVVYGCTVDGKTALGRHATSGNSSDNVGIGFCAIVGGTGQFNVAVGKNIARGLTGGSCNVFMGYSAGNCNTGGSQNVAIGYSALSSNASGARNTAIGFGVLSAALANQDSNDNTAIGFQALKNNCGGCNIAVGVNTMSGDFCLTNNSIAIGNCAFLCARGNNNIILGTCTFHTSTSTLNVNNVIIGHQTLKASDEVSDNVIIGNCALAAASTISDRHCRNVILGFNAAAAYTSNIFNSIIIGSSALCTQGPNPGIIVIGTATPHPSGVGATTLESYTLGIGYACCWQVRANCSGYVCFGANATGGIVDRTGSAGLCGQVLSSGGPSCGLKWVDAGGVPFATPTVGGIVYGKTCCALGADTYYGFQAGLSSNTADKQNTAMGQGALASNVTGCGITAFGASAGKSLVGGNNYNFSTFVGSQAGDQVTVGGSNTYLGALAGFCNRCGGDNVAIGICALGTTCGSTTNFDSSFNIAIGNKALQNPGLSRDNVVIGTCAASNLANTSLCENTYIGGFSSCVTNSTNCFNTGVGFRALQNSPSLRNTALGHRAGQNATGASVGNLMLGEDASSAFQCGSFNIFIGSRSGCSTSSFNGDCNVIIGSSVPLPAVGSCQLAIGYAAGCCWITGCANRNIRPAAGVLDCTGSAGAVGQVLVSTGANSVCWGPPGGVAAASPTVQGAVFGATCSNVSISRVSLGVCSGMNNTCNWNILIGNCTLCIASASADNILIGHSIGNTLAAAGGCNVWVGGGTGTSFATGSAFNTLLGYGAAASNNASSNGCGVNNVAIGAYAFQNNCAAGGTGSCAVCPINNTVVGTCAGRQLRGSNSVFVGFDAGGALPMTGYQSCTTVIGASAGRTLVGIGNTIVGARSGQCAGDASTLIGTCSAPTATGARNTTLGSFSLSALTTGGENIAIGSYAGCNITTGVGNVIIGNSVQTDSPTCNCQLKIGSGTLTWITGYGDASVTIAGGIRDNAGNLGIAGQVLATTGTGQNYWCSASAVAAIQCSSITGKGAILTGCAASTVCALPVGANGQILTADSACVTGLKWCVPNYLPNIVTAKGQIIVGTGAATTTALPVGTNGQLLTADSACATGLKWVNVSGFGPASPTSEGTLLGKTSCDCLAPTLVGYRAGCFLALGCGITGGQHTLIGADAGWFMSCGGANLLGNTAVGMSSQWNASAGDRNTSVGAWSLCRNVSGGCSVAVGYDAATRSCIFNGGVALGAYALGCANDWCSRGDIAIGGFAMQCYTGGGSAVGCNIVIGYCSGMPSGNRNVIIGPNICCTSQQLCSLYIGYDNNCFWLTGCANKSIKPGAGIVDSLGNTGTAGQVLASTGSNALCWISLTSAGNIPASCITGKGALITGTAASAPTALAVGANNTVLIADSACPTGLKWGAAPDTIACNATRGVVYGYTCDCGTSPAFSFTNTALGKFAGASAQNCNTVCQSTFLGWCAGFTAQGSSTENTFVGFESARNSGTGFGNTVIGARSANSLCVSGSCSFTENTYVGSNITTNSCYYTEGVHLGSYSNRCALYGRGNVFVGNYAGDTWCNNNVSCSLDGFNIAIGYNAMSGQTTGFNNVIIGSFAGSTSTNAKRLININNGSNNVIIGNNSTTNAYVKVNWTVGSDVRDKAIDPTGVPYGMEFVRGIEPIRYQFCNRETGEITDNRVHYGFSAQNLKSLETGTDESIIIQDQGERLYFTEAHLTPVLVNALKELDAEMRKLREEFNEYRKTHP